MTDDNGVSTTPLSSLSDKYRAVVLELARERADSLDRTQKQIVADCVERHGVEEFHPTLINKVRDTYPELINEREQAVLNHHDTTEQGNVRVEGNIDLTDEAEYPKPQAVRDRPVKAIAGENGEGGTVTLEVDTETLYRIITGNLGHTSRQELFEQVVGGA